MPCDTVQEAVLLHLESGENLSAEAVRHLDTCADCREFQRKQESIGRIMDESVDPVTIPSLRGRFPARITRAERRCVGFVFLLGTFLLILLPRFIPSLLTPLDDTLIVTVDLTRYAARFLHHPLFLFFFLFSFLFSATLAFLLKGVVKVWE